MKEAGRMRRELRPRAIGIDGSRSSPRYARGCRFFGKCQGDYADLRRAAKASTPSSVAITARQADDGVRANIRITRRPPSLHDAQH